MKPECSTCRESNYSASIEPVNGLGRPLLFIRCTHCHTVISVIDIHANDEIIERITKLEESLGRILNPGSVV